MSAMDLKWEMAFKTSITTFLYLCGFGVIALAVTFLGSVLTTGLTLTEDIEGILFMMFFIVALTIFCVGGFTSFYKVSLSSISKIEWPEALKGGIIAYIYICIAGFILLLVLSIQNLVQVISDALLSINIGGLNQIIEVITGTMRRTANYYTDLIVIIVLMLISLGSLAAIIKIGINLTKKKFKWRSTFSPALSSFLLIAILVIFILIIGFVLSIATIILANTFEVFLQGFGIVEIVNLGIDFFFLLIVGFVVILILTIITKTLADTYRSIEWPTTYTHRKGFKQRLLGTWKQYIEVKHGIAGLFLVVLFIVLAVIAPIVFPKYPGQLARVGPDYAAPLWAREVMDPSAPPLKNFVPDSTFTDDSAWNFSSITLMSSLIPELNIPNDPKGSWEYDTDIKTEGSRSVKMSITDNISTNLLYRHKTSVRGVTSFPYNYSAPTWVIVKFDLKLTYNGSNPNFISPYVRLQNPNSEWPEYLSRAEVEPPFHDEWITYTRNISFLGYHYVFQEDAMVYIEFGLEWSNTQSNPYNPPVDAEENGTATAWFDNIRVILQPSFYGWLGTTNEGQDVLAQLFWGAQVSLFIGLVATFIGVFVGLLVGLTSGHFGGYIDEILMRIVDFFLIMPGLPIMMILSALFSPSLEVTTLIIALFAWPGPSRVIRSQVLVEKEKAYVEAARAAGAGDVYIIFKHVFPNVLTLVFVQLATGVSGAILSEAGLSFLALTPQGLVSWGRMLQAGYNAGALQNRAWWFVIPPGLAICLLSMGFVFIGYAVDKAMNPRQREL
ncbi:MAG: ABC transporter permease [Candidatus Thorarchaeota archaeon]